MTEAIYSSSPIVKTETVELVEQILLGTEKSLKFVPFMQNLIWLRETEAKVSFWHGDKYFKDGSTHSDYYGLFGSYDGAIEDASQFQKSYKIDKSSSLEMRVYLSVEEYPVVRDNSTDGLIYNTPSTKNIRYASIQDKQWYYNNQEKLQRYMKIMNRASNAETSEALIQAANEIIELLRVKRKPLEKDVLVWSSKVFDEENITRLKELYMK